MPRGGVDAPVVVVTGITGSGKSTLCRWLAERGAFVLEADRVGHEFLLEAAIQAQLAEAFGPEVFTGEGSVDRKRLGRIVFADPQALDRLNQIIHPPLVGELQRRIAALKKSRAAELIVVDAALHYQFEPRLPCDFVVAASVAEDEAVRRICQRDDLSDAAARERLDRQRDVAAALGRADLILDTAVDPVTLRRQLLTGVDGLTGLNLWESDPRGEDHGSRV